MSENEIGDQPIQEEYKEKMNQLAKFIDGFFNPDKENKDVGFCLMVFPFGDNGRANYISNAVRKDVIILLKEQLARFEGMADQTGRA
jgi:hypothetical protein